jgi:hypothetical protein
MALDPSGALSIEGITIMRRFRLALTAATAVLAAGALAPSSASATPLSPSTALRTVLDDMSPIQDVAICFYLDGWNGPGMYECGYRHRRGQGWHGRREGYNDRDHDRGRRNSPNDRGNDDGRGRR